MRRFVSCPLLACILTPAAALAWEDHSLTARPALAAMPEVAEVPLVQVETLQEFLEAEQEGLAKLLEDEETWALANVPTYPARPARLAFEPGGDVATLQTRLLEALRMAPDVRLALYYKAPFGDEAPAEGSIPWGEVTTLSDPGVLEHATFIGLEPGDRLPALEILVSACDEPDYGFDLGVWEDSASEWGPRYGLGAQPFGDPTKEYSAQAPLHMGFYQEANIIYKLASFLGRTYPELRVHQYQSLARYAFETGHDYWGWRFTGWALHYVQDLTMPYHARVLPGVSTVRMLWINFLSVIGIHGPADDALRLVSNRHMVLEYFVRGVVEDSLRAEGGQHAFHEALTDGTAESRFGGYGDGYLRHTLTVETVSRAKAIDKALEDNVPHRLVSDPAYIVDTTEPDMDVLTEVREDTPEGEVVLMEAFTPLLVSFGVHSRIFIRAVREGMTPAQLPPETEAMDAPADAPDPDLGQEPEPE